MKSVFRVLVITSQKSLGWRHRNISIDIEKYLISVNIVLVSDRFEKPGIGPQLENVLNRLRV